MIMEDERKLIEFIVSFYLIDSFDEDAEPIEWERNVFADDEPDAIEKVAFQEFPNPEDAVNRAHLRTCLTVKPANNGKHH